MSKNITFLKKHKCLGKKVEANFKIPSKKSEISHALNYTVKNVQEVAAIFV